MKSLGLLFVSFPLAIYRGWVVSTLWGWFVVPQFGVPALPVIYAIGALILLTLVVDQGYNPTLEAARKNKEGTCLFWGVSMTTMALLIGYLVSLFR